MSTPLLFSLFFSFLPPPSLSLTHTLADAPKEGGGIESENGRGESLKSERGDLVEREEGGKELRGR